MGGTTTKPTPVVSVTSMGNISSNRQSHTKEQMFYWATSYLATFSDRTRSTTASERSVCLEFVNY